MPASRLVFEGPTCDGRLIWVLIKVIFLFSEGSFFCVSSRSSVLLLAPLLAEADSAPCHDPWPPRSLSRDGLCSRFRWMADHVPAFRVPGARVHILTSPDQFYQAMKVGAAVWNEEESQLLDVCV